MLFKRNKNTINIAAIVRLLGILMLIEAAFMAIPLATSIAYGELDTIKSFAYSIAITLGCGILAVVVPSHNNDMGKREGFLLTGLSWTVFSLFGMIPFILIENGLGVADAYFESMSGFTTTGASAFPSVENLPKGILLWRAISHFIGGMGIILFTLAVIPMLNKQSGLQLFNAEVTGITHEKIRPRISHTAKSLWLVYIAINAMLILLLWMGPMDLFDAVCHSFSAIATGGFSNHDNSIMFYNSDYVKIVLTIFMFLAGVSFGLIYKLSRGHFSEFLKNDATKWYLYIVLGSSLCIGLIEYFCNEGSLPRLVIDIPFQVVSGMTSTGYSATDINMWSQGSILLLMLLMTAGGCAGSTAGGVKVDRIVLIGKNLKNELYKILYPNTISPVRVNGKILSNDFTAKVSAFMLILLALFAGGTLSLTLCGINIFDAMFASLSCICNNGLGYGFTGSSFAHINDFGKWTMSFLMLAGRLEFFTVVILFTRAFWYK